MKDTVDLAKGWFSKKAIQGQDAPPTCIVGPETEVGYAQSFLDKQYEPRNTRNTRKEIWGS